MVDIIKNVEPLFLKLFGQIFIDHLTNIVSLNLSPNTFFVVLPQVFVIKYLQLLENGGVIEGVKLVDQSHALTERFLLASQDLNLVSDNHLVFGDLNRLGLNSVLD